MLGIAGLLGLLMIGASVDFGDLLAPQSDDDPDADAGLNKEATSDDTLEGSDDPDSILAQMGNDVVYGAGGGDTLMGSGGDDLIDGAEGDDSIDGGDGNDTLAGELGNDTVLGGAGNDEMAGYAGDDSMDGGTGNDTLIGGEGDDTLAGGDGDDGLMGGYGDDLVVGGQGTDVVNGNEGNDTLAGMEYAGDLSDIQDDGVTDYLNGSNGNDTLILGAGDMAHGGDDADIFTLGDWIGANGPAVIQDYDGAEDSLVVVYDATNHPDPELTLGSDPGNPDSVVLMLDGTPLAVLTDPVALDLSSVALVPAAAA